MHPPFYRHLIMWGPGVTILYVKLTMVRITDHYSGPSYCHLTRWGLAWQYLDIIKLTMVTIPISSCRPPYYKGLLPCLDNRGLAWQPSIRVLVPVDVEPNICSDWTITLTIQATILVQATWHITQQCGLHSIRPLRPRTSSLMKLREILFIESDCPQDSSLGGNIAVHVDKFSNMPGSLRRI